MANFCSHCGAGTKPGANFCEACGTRLMPDMAQPPQPAAFVENENPYRRSNGINENPAGTGKTAGRENAGYTVDSASSYNPFPESGIRQMLFSTKGRLNRWRYFKRCWGIFGLAFLMLIVSGVFIGTNHAVMGGLTLLSIIVGAEVASICLVVRRFHDMEPPNNTDYNFMVKRMGAYIGFIFASWVWEWAWILTTLMSLYLLFNPGVKGPNRHGADPCSN